MPLTRITQTAEWRQWKVAPRKGLFSSEIASLLGLEAARVRTDIIDGKIPGIALESQGQVFALAAEVSDIVVTYNLPTEPERSLLNRTQYDVRHDLMQLGIPIIHQRGHKREYKIPHEFNSEGELGTINKMISETY